MQDGNDRFLVQLELYRSNTATVFGFDNGWTLLQVQEILSALKANKSVATLDINAGQCPLPAIPLLVDCIESNQRIEEVTVRCGDIQERYKIWRILRAVLQNPSIKKLKTNELGNCPEEIFNLISKTNALSDFELEEPNMHLLTTEMARHVAAGLAQNSSVEKLTLCMANFKSFGIVISGISASKIKSLTVQIQGSTARSYEAIANMLHVAPSLKMLKIDNGNNSSLEDDNDGGRLRSELFCALGHPGCGVEKLELWSIQLGKYDGASTPQVNRHLQVLVLNDINICNNKSVSLLWHLVGLKELHVTIPGFENNHDPDCWAELVRRNPNLLKLSIRDTNWADCAKGLISGACGHESLQSLVFDMSNYDVNLDAHAGAELFRLLKETKYLRTLHMSGFRIHRESAELMAEGICENKTLLDLVFEDCEIRFSVLTVLVESFAVNQTIATFCIGECTIRGSDEEERIFCETLSYVFRVNTSLEGFRLPPMKIDAENRLMNILVGGLSPNNTIKTIDFARCTLDQAALSGLEEALVANPQMLSISSVILPSLTGKEAIKPFIRNLVHMPYIKEVAIQDSLDAEGKELLLQTVMKKKTLRAFERLTDNPNNHPVDAQIDFYLKLNRLGRQIVETPNVSASCWPILLSRMTSKANKDVAALFYFVREYFANHQHDPTKPQQQQQPPPPLEHGLPFKRARLE